MKQLAATILTVMLTCVSAMADIFYVDASRPDDSGDGTSWATAKKTIQGGVDVTSAGDTVLVTNGTYDTGETVTPSRSSSNRVVITENITVKSVNGPEVTFIVGASDNGTNGPAAVRGVYMTTGLLAGFTVTNGHTMNSGNDDYDRSSGGVNMYGGSGAVVSNCVIVGNSADDNAGGFYYGTLYDCTIEGNSAVLDGGGGRNGTLHDCTIRDNEAGDDGGGTFLCTLTGCTIADNSAVDAGGGNYGGTLNDCTISGNEAGGNGGGNNGGTLDNCIISNNTTTAGDGGGTYRGVLNDCTIVDNSAGDDGGGTANTATLTNCVIRGNHADDLGGGAFGSTLHNCLIADNTSIDDGGGSCQAYLYNCTITGNSSADRGGGSGNDDGLWNCIVYFNTATNGYDNWSNADPVFTNCCTTPEPGGTGNITDDPQFVDDSSDFHLQTGSPCIDAGSNAFVAASTDLDGNTRIVGDAVDMGAYENQGATLVVLYGFEVGVAGNEVVVRWMTASESETLGFRLFRSQESGGGSQPPSQGSVVPGWVQVGEFIPAQGYANGGIGAEYSVIDPDAVPGETCTYKLVEYETDGGTEKYGPFERRAYALKITAPFAVTDNGIVLRWLSRGNEFYRILRATNLSQSAFDIRQSAIPATPPENVYTDAVHSADAVFYRIEVEDN